MIVTEKITSQYIHDEMTRLYADVENVLKKIFEQAGNKIQPETQEDVQQKIVGTKQAIDRFKSKYVSISDDKD
ncbi:MAG TPA: hypothetical protein V6C78_18585 [Crinalium sp.]|jgi:ElaB/YqjD/DUF883 family membrane-anchored ribosome-binding protein